MILLFDFILVLGVSYWIVARAMRPVAASKAMQKRLTLIHQPELLTTDGDALDIGTRGKRDYAAKLGQFLQKYSFSKKLETLILHAHSDMTVGAVVFASVGAGLSAALCCGIFVRLVAVDGLSFLIGISIPTILLKVKRGRRLKAFNQALPDALDLMARALRAGHSLGSSMELVGQQSPAPLGAEFIEVFQQQKFGVRFREALLAMGHRVPSSDLHFLITAILVQRETGGDLTEILDRTSHVIRERVRIEGEVRTYTAQGRLTGWILGLLPVVMLVLINLISPGYSDVLFHDPVGHKLLYAAAALIVTGGLIIRKIVNVQV